MKYAATWLADFFAGKLQATSSIAALVSTAANTSSDPTPSVLEASTSYAKYFQIGALACTVAWLIFVIIGIVYHKKIKVAIAIIREAAKALQGMSLSCARTLHLPVCLSVCVPAHAPIFLATTTSRVCCVSKLTKLVASTLALPLHHSLSPPPSSSSSSSFTCFLSL